MQNFPYFRGGWPVLFFIFIDPVGKSPGNHKQECKSAGHVASYPVFHRSCQSVFRTASDDSCGGGLGTRLYIGHAREKPYLSICAYEIGDL